MAVDFTNLALAPCVAAFGEPVTYQPGSGAAVSVNRAGLPLMGIFNAAATEDKVNGDTGEVIQVSVPTLALNINDLPVGTTPPYRNAMITVRGRLWQIGEAVPDNYGQLMLRLRLVQ